MILVEEHTKPFAKQEMEALRASSLPFTTIPSQKIFDPAPDLNKYTEPVFLRCSVPTVEKCLYIYPEHKLLIPDSDRTSSWFALPRDDRWEEYIQRVIEFVPVSRNADGEYQSPQLKDTLNKVFRDGVFLKSENKSNLTARLYPTIRDAYTAALEAMAYSCHRSPSGFMVSEPLHIDTADTEFKKAEYRLFVIGGSVATASLFTDDIQKNVVPNKVIDFGNRFAQDYIADLPSTYTLDVALCTNRPVVVELNEIQASGLFAGHNMNLFYKSIEDLFNV